MIDPNDVVLSHFSLRYTDFDARLDAAAGAGFTDIGLSITSVVTALGGTDADAADLRRRSDRKGVRVAELEALRAWPATDEERARYRVAEAAAFALADAFSSRYLQVIGPCPADPDEAAEVFAGLCDRAAEHGLTVGIEFLPFTNIVDADAAGALVRRAGRVNGGVCVDAWHHFRGARDDGQIQALGPELVAAVQLDDGTTVPEDPDYLTDCLENRRVLGEGEFDLVGLVRLLDGMDVSVPVSLEVISTQLQARPPEVVCGRLMQSWHDLLAAAR